ncbi:MAG: hypothetical protein Q8907_03635 [Bacteroidota bacterium]|nr:hypothetical protein [Bacteroidota bacterium]MDP4273351.1 hypothetical protein [Bacteroidota bacterium]
MGNWFFHLLFLLALCPFAQAQDSFEPLHGLTGYDYNIKGELELSFTHSIDFKNGTKSEETYRIKSPVLLSFNLNDLKFFKAQPKEFTGYAENQYDAYSGYSGGGLVDIPDGGFREEENWMQVEKHAKWWENGGLTEINAHGEIYPVLKVYFSIPDFPEKYTKGLDQLQFRVTIAGSSDPHFHPVRNVVADNNNQNLNSTGTKTELIDEETLNKLELADPAAAVEMKKAAGLLQTSSPGLSVNVSCGSFYGQDLANALMANNLLEADKAKKQAFESQFEQAYFKNMPHINVMKLVNFLIKPVGNYVTPISGTFYSDSESGSEKATYNGSLRLYGSQITKNN